MRHDGVAQHRHAAHHRIGDVDGVLTGLLGDGDGHSGILAAVLARHAVPDIAARRKWAIADGGHVLQEDRLAVADADHQLRDIAGILEEGTRFDGDRAVGDEQFAYRQAKVGRLQCGPKVGHGHAAAGHSRRIDLDDHGASGSAYRSDLARSGDALEIALDAVGNALEVEGADRGVFAEQRERHDRHVVDALGLDQRIEDAEALGQPIGIRIDRVVEAHQGLGAADSRLVLHRHDGEARPGDRHHVLDAGDLRQHLFRWRSHHLLHVPRRCAGKWNQHVRHRHVDLRLFLARRHEDREDAQEKRGDREQRRDLRRLEKGSDVAGDAERFAHVVAFTVHGPPPADPTPRARPR